MRLHSIGVRVYYEDTDAGGIVYYANYLRYFERARTDWLRAAGITHQELSQVDGLGLVVRECGVQYLRPARLDDLLAIEVGLADPATDLGRASLRLTHRALLVERSADGAAGAGAGPQAALRTEAGSQPALRTGVDSGAGGGYQTVLATATVRIACIAGRTGRPAPLPQRVLLAISGQLSGKALPQDPLQAASSFSQQNITTVTPDGTTAQE